MPWVKRFDLNPSVSFARLWADRQAATTALVVRLRKNCERFRRRECAFLNTPLAGSA